jgi:pantoate--beta-alanine ligase
MPKLATTITAVREKIAAARAAGKRIGLVPTMGALHEGHLSLIRHARKDCGCVVVSIFVNPAQFARGEDLEKYPRDLDKDMKLCGDADADIIFAPAGDEMYPAEFATYVNPDDSLAGKLCGAARPGHFRGVDTVVLKLFNICTPDAAYFGQKDYQQSVIIRRMAVDLDLDIEIVVCPTVREEDGLAMSSRNFYLNREQRAQATCLYKALLAAKNAVKDEKIANATLVKSRMLNIISQASEARVDYVEIVDPESLEPLKELKGQVVAVLAVYVGPARLIDNMILQAP